MLATRSRSQLLIVDLQARLVPHIDGAGRVLANAARLIGYARRLGVPITVTEHMPDKLGATVPELARLTNGAGPALTKTTFSAWRDDAIRRRLVEARAERREQVVVAGCETHVCVMQTCLDLIGQGYDVLLVGDASASRDPEVRGLALERLSRAGATIVSHEMVAFEWLERADTPEFRDLIGVIK